jgi:hypothetical protein
VAGVCSGSAAPPRRWDDQVTLAERAFDATLTATVTPT